MSSVSVAITPLNLFGLATLAMLLGPLAYKMLKGKGWAIELLDAFVMVAILGLLATHVFPEAFSALGAWAVLPIAAGWALPILFSRSDRFGGRTADGLAVGLAVAGLAVHTLLDGVALASADRPGHGTTGLAFAVVLHRIPVGMFVWHLPRTLFGRRAAVGLLGLIVASTGFGLTLGTQYVEALHGPVFAGFQALIAGSLLHVVLEHSHGEAEPTSGRKLRFGELAGIVLAIASLVAVSQLGVNEHEHNATAGLSGQFAALLALAVGVTLLRKRARDRIRRLLGLKTEEHEHHH